MIPADSMARPRQNVQRTTLHSSTWSARRGLSTRTTETDGHEEGWVKSKPDHAGRPTAHILTRDYTSAHINGDLHNATQLYTDGSWIDPARGRSGLVTDWEPARWEWRRWDQRTADDGTRSPQPNGHTPDPSTTHKRGSRGLTAEL